MENQRQWWEEWLPYVILSPLGWIYGMAEIQRRGVRHPGALAAGEPPGTSTSRLLITPGAVKISRAPARASRIEVAAEYSI